MQKQSLCAGAALWVWRKLLWMAERKGLKLGFALVALHLLTANPEREDSPRCHGSTDIMSSRGKRSFFPRVLIENRLQESERSKISTIIQSQSVSWKKNFAYFFSLLRDIRAVWFYFFFPTEEQIPTTHGFRSAIIEDHNVREMAMTSNKKSWDRQGENPVLC